MIKFQTMSGILLMLLFLLVGNAAGEKIVFVSSGQLAPWEEPWDQEWGRSFSCSRGYEVERPRCTMKRRAAQR